MSKFKFEPVEKGTVEIPVEELRKIADDLVNSYRKMSFVDIGNFLQKYLPKPPKPKLTLKEIKIGQTFRFTDMSGPPCGRLNMKTANGYIFISSDGKPGFALVHGGFDSPYLQKEVELVESPSEQLRLVVGHQPCGVE